MMMLRRDSAREGRTPRGSARGMTSAVATAPERELGLDTLLPSELEIGPWNDNDRHGQKHHCRGGKALAQVLCPEHEFVDIFRGNLRGVARAAAGLRHHQV